MSLKETSFKVFFGFLGLTIIVIIIVHLSHKSTYKSECKTDADCQSSKNPYSKCIYDPDYNKNVCVSKDSKVCSLIKPQSCKCTSLVKNGEVCGQSNCKSCINEPQFQCVHLDSPYEWRQGDQKITIPPNKNKDEGWCMPPIPQENTNCNPFTSDTILIQKSDTEYEWGCECKYPSQITQGHPTSDCNIDKTCGNVSGSNESSKLYVPNIGKSAKKCKDDTDCVSGDICYGPDDKQKTCYSKWVENQHKIDPIKYGICACPTDYVYIGNECKYQDNEDQCDTSGSVKECVQDSCEGNDNRGKLMKDSDGSYCQCKTGYVNCSMNNKTETDKIFQSSCRIPVCLDDPCAPGGYAKPIPGGGGSSCICDNDKGYYLIDDSSSVNGQSCAKLCDNNGPCGTGSARRGNCKVITDKNKDAKAVCDPCSCGYADYDEKTNPFCYNYAPDDAKQLEDGKCLGDEHCCSGLCWLWGKCAAPEDIHH